MARGTVAVRLGAGRLQATPRGRSHLQAQEKEEVVVAVVVVGMAAVPVRLRSRGGCRSSAAVAGATFTPCTNATRC